MIDIAWKPAYVVDAKKVRAKNIKLSLGASAKLQTFN